MQRSDFILIQGKLDTRAATVIAGIPFYCSTGRNSKQSNTWFPISGVNPALLETDSTIRHPGWLLKPVFGRLDNRYPSGLLTNYFFVLDARFNRSLPLLARFGNFEGMCFSMLIGGGFWIKPEGKELELFIKKKYHTALSRLVACYGTRIASAANFSCNELIPQYKTPKEIQSINNWLLSQKSRATLDHEMRPTIDFNYSGITIPNQFLKLECINELNKYISFRIQKRDEQNSNYYPGLGFFGLSAVDKISAANNLIKIFNGKNDIIFSADEISALHNGKLGSIFSRYKYLLPHQITATIDVKVCMDFRIL